MGLMQGVLRWWTLRKCRAVGKGVCVRGLVSVAGAGRVEVGDYVVLDARAAGIELNAGPGASLVLGRGVRLDGGVSIEAMSRVEVGDFTRIRGFAKILDTHFHPITGNRQIDPPAPIPVAIGANCDIGWRTVVLPGAILGSGVQAQGNSVVSRPVPQNTVVGGSPTRRLPQESPVLTKPDALVSPKTGASVLPTIDAARAMAMRLLRRGPVGIARRLLSLARIRWALRGHELGRNVAVQGRMITEVQGSVKIGNNVKFFAHVVSSQLIVHEEALLEVGDDVICNYGVSIEASERIHIGHRCLLGSFVQLCDRGSIRNGPIVIEDDVWLAHGVIVEPGVTIGTGSVIAAGAVVTADIPPRSLAIGNPARALSLTLRTGAAG